MKRYRLLNHLELEDKFKVETCFIAITYVLSSFPLLSFGLRSIVTIIWALLGIICVYKNGVRNIKFYKNDRIILLFLFTSFFILVFSLIYSQNISEGIGQLTKMISVLIVPIIFYINNSLFNKKRIEVILKFFCFSVLVFMLYQIVLLLFNLEILTDELSYTEIKLNNLHHLTEISEDQIQRIKVRRFRNFMMNLSGSHPIYQGLWLSFVIYYNYYNLRFRENKVFYNVLRIISICFMLFWMILLSSRMPLIATFISGMFVIFLFKHFKLKKIALFGVIFFGCFLVIFSTFKPIHTRYKELYQSMLVLPGKGNNTDNYNSTSVRSGIYYCSALLAKDHWLFGLGVGDVQDNLSECYDQKIGAKVYKWKKYNSHNQYMFFLLSSGILGLTTFILFIIFLIRKILVVKSSIIFYFLFSTSIVFLTENLLSRSDGILFFGLFVSIALIITKENKVI